MMSPDMREEQFGTDTALLRHEIDETNVKIDSHQRGADNSKSYCRDPSIVLQGHQLRKLFENSAAIKRIFM